MLYSLFKTITIFHKDGRVIFLGNNITISKFFRLFYDFNDAKYICETVFNSKYTDDSLDNVKRYFSKILNCNMDDIYQKIDDLFFDDWTVELYCKCYNLNNPTLKDILDLSLKVIEERPSVIDLNHRRLVFIEHLMRPLITAVSTLVMMLMNGRQILKFPMDSVSIIDYFFSDKGLQSNFFYDIDNGYNGLLSLKASFKSPGGDKAMPSEISSIHPTYKGRICPTTVSNKSTGQVIALVPEQKIDLKFGLFK
jgi:hypothetical protein